MHEARQLLAPKTGFVVLGGQAGASVPVLGQARGDPRPGWRLWRRAFTWAIRSRAANVVAKASAKTMVLLQLLPQPSLHGQRY